MSNLYFLTFKSPNEAEKTLSKNYINLKKKLYKISQLRSLLRDKINLCNSSILTHVSNYMYNTMLHCQSIMNIINSSYIYIIKQQSISLLNKLDKFSLTDQLYRDILNDIKHINRLIEKKINIPHVLSQYNENDPIYNCVQNISKSNDLIHLHKYPYKKWHITCFSKIIKQFNKLSTISELSIENKLYPIHETFIICNIHQNNNISFSVHQCQSILKQKVIIDNLDIHYIINVIYNSFVDRFYKKDLLLIPLYFKIKHKLKTLTQIGFISIHNLHNLHITIHSTDNGISIYSEYENVFSDIYAFILTYLKKKFIDKYPNLIDTNSTYSVQPIHRNVYTLFNHNDRVIYLSTHQLILYLLSFYTNKKINYVDSISGFLNVRYIVSNVIKESVRLPLSYSELNISIQGHNCILHIFKNGSTDNYNHATKITEFTLYNDCFKFSGSTNTTLLDIIQSGNDGYTYVVTNEENGFIFVMTCTLNINTNYIEIHNVCKNHNIKKLSGIQMCNIIINNFVKKQEEFLFRYGIRLVLECYNPKVIPALKLYNSFGFKILSGVENPYDYMSYSKSNAFIMSKEFYMPEKPISITDNINTLYTICPYKTTQLFQILKSILLENAIDFKHNTIDEIDSNTLVNKNISKKQLTELYQIVTNNKNDDKTKKEYILKYILEII